MDGATFLGLSHLQGVKVIRGDPAVRFHGLHIVSKQPCCKRGCCARQAMDRQADRQRAVVRRSCIILYAADWDAGHVVNIGWFHRAVIEGRG